MMQETVQLSGMRRTVMRFEKKYMCMYLRVGMSELKTLLSFHRIYSTEQRTITYNIFRMQNNKGGEGIVESGCRVVH